MLTNKQIIIAKRQKVRKLYFEKHLRKVDIARKIGVSRPFIDKVLSLSKEEILADRRGWELGLLRNHNNLEVERILSIRLTLAECNFFFYGTLQIRQIYHDIYPNEPCPDERFIARVIRESRLTKHHKHGLNRFHHYPEMTIMSLGKTIEEIDFVEKYLENTTKPLNFFARTYWPPIGIARYSRIPSQRSVYARISLEADWQSGLPVPNVIKLDNDIAFASTGIRMREIAGFPSWLMGIGIIPVFVAFSAPWQNGRLEGTNSVFGRKIWKMYRFSSPEKVDQTISLFHQASDNYRGIQLPENSPLFSKINPAEKIYFIRKVEENHFNQGAIMVLKEQIILPQEYINNFVLAEVDVRQQNIKVFFEKDDKTLLPLIKPLPFKVRLNKMRKM